MTHPLLSLRDGPVARLRLNRPELHNAFDAMLIAALTGALEALGPRRRGPRRWCWRATAPRSRPAPT